MIASFHKVIKVLAAGLLLAFAVAEPVQAQVPAAATPAEPQRYELGGITISGARYLDANTLIGLTGLQSR